MSFQHVLHFGVGRSQIEWKLKVKTDISGAKIGQNDHSNTYIESTTVLSDILMMCVCTCKYHALKCRGKNTIPYNSIDTIPYSIYGRSDVLSRCLGCGNLKCHVRPPQAIRFSVAGLSYEYFWRCYVKLEPGTTEWNQTIDIRDYVTSNLLHVSR